MQWIETKVIFDSPDLDLACELIADIFYQFEIQGVVIEDPNIDQSLDWAQDALDTPTDHAVIGFIPDNPLLGERQRELETALVRLQQDNPIETHVAYRKIDEEDWAESWKAYFWPIKISDRLVVKPSWREYTPMGEELVIEIDPGMAFGTGSHPTTALCLEMIEDYLKPRSRFLDVGCGSGILMIAAHKLGAAHVSGIDIDEVAIDVAGINLIKNQIPPDRFQLQTGHLTDNWPHAFDIIVANILSGVIIALLEELQRVLHPQGVLICSGIIKENNQQVIKAMQGIGFSVDRNIIKEEWTAIAAKRASHQSP